MTEATAQPDTAQRSLFLENFQELEDTYRVSALQGDSAPPENAEDEVDFHYICFIRSRRGQLYRMDGDMEGPVNLGIHLDEENDLFCEEALSAVRTAIKQGGGNVNFSLMALAEAEE